MAHAREMMCIDGKAHGRHVWACVLDLDYTLWPLNAKDVLPPLVSSVCELTGEVVVVDANKNCIRLYPGVRQAIACARKDKNVRLAVASACPTRKVAFVLLQKFGLGFLTKCAEVYPGKNGNKLQHLRNISKRLGIPLRRIALLDDIRNNISTARREGAVGILIDRKIGLRLADVSSAKAQLEDNRKSKAFMERFLVKPGSRAVKRPLGTSSDKSGCLKKIRVSSTQ